MECTIQELPPEIFAGTRAEVEDHLSALGHLPRVWNPIDRLPDDAAAFFTSDGLAAGGAGKSWCRHRRIECADGSPGLMLVCFTVYPDGTSEEWSSNTCDN